MLKTKRTLIDVAEPDDAPLLLRYHTENRDHLAPWEPLREVEYLTLDKQSSLINERREAYAAGNAYHFVAFAPGRSEVLGLCNFTGVVRGPFQACYLGYSITKRHEGTGLMSEVLEACLTYMFERVSLHRVMAAYMPRNTRSGRLLERLGFEREGYARDYLKIAGRWEDHILTAKIAE